MNVDLHYQASLPPPALAGLVEGIWRLHNRSGQVKSLAILPDGRVDVFFTYADHEPFRVLLLGLGSQPDPTSLPPGAVIGAVSLWLPAVEYLLHTRVADIRDSARELPTGFWGIVPADLLDFATFKHKVAQALLASYTAPLDLRKQRLFAQLYASHGALPVHALAAHAGWSSRQINRYFQATFGLSLKAYCAILRFRASLAHLRAGHLYPEQPYADQSHFIREVRKLAGARPRELAQNQHGRFIQLSALPEE